MEAKKLLRKSAMRALTATPSIITGSVAIASSFVFLNPLPAILWGLWAGVWTIAALQSGRYGQQIIEEERAGRTQRAAAERETLRRQIVRTLRSPPFTRWVAQGGLPDYLARYDHLLDLRRRIDQVLRSRQEATVETETGIAQQLDGMLAAYLRFVWSRIMYLQILTGQRVPAGVYAGSPESEPRSRQRETSAHPVIRQVRSWFLDEDGDQVPTADTDEHDSAAWVGTSDQPPGRRGGGFNLNASREAADAKLASLQERMAREPHAKEILASNMKLLERQRQLLEDCAARDQRVTAQLDAFEDALDLILSQVSATQFDAGGVVEHMNSLAGEVADTEEFVRTMQPLSDGLLDGTMFVEEAVRS